jgi:hypothetical protein
MSLEQKREYYFDEYQKDLKTFPLGFTFEEFLLDRLSCTEIVKNNFKKFIKDSIIEKQ